MRVSRLRGIPVAVRLPREPVASADPRRAGDQLRDAAQVRGLIHVARDSKGGLCIEIKSPQDLERELDLDLGNIFHNSLSWFFTDDPEEDGTWGVETDMRGVYRCGSSALRGGAVSGVPGFLVARKIFEEERVLVPG